MTISKDISVMDAPDSPDFIWGVRAIGAALGRPEKALYNVLPRHKVAGVRRIGGQWVLHVPTFRASFGEHEASSK